MLPPDHNAGKLYRTHGDYVGERCIMAEADRRTATVKAIAPTTCLAISCDSLKKIFHSLGKDLSILMARNYHRSGVSMMPVTKLGGFDLSQSLDGTHTVALTRDSLVLRLI